MSRRLTGAILLTAAVAGGAAWIVRAQPAPLPLPMSRRSRLR